MRSPWGRVQAPGERGGGRQALAAEERYRGVTGNAPSQEGPWGQRGQAGREAQEAARVIRRKAWWRPGWGRQWGWGLAGAAGCGRGRDSPRRRSPVMQVGLEGVACGGLVSAPRPPLARVSSGG